MKKLKLSILLITAILFTASVSAQEKGQAFKEFKTEKSTIESYKGQVLWAELGATKNENLVDRLDEAMRSGNCTELISVGVQLDFFEGAFGTDSKVITSKEISNHIVNFMSKGVNSESELNLCIKYAEKVENKEAADKLNDIKAEYESAAFAEEDGCTGTLLIQNGSGYTLKVYVDGYYIGRLYSGNETYDYVYYGTHSVEFIDDWGATYRWANIYVPCGGYGYATAW